MGDETWWMKDINEFLEDGKQWINGNWISRGEKTESQVPTELEASLKRLICGQDQKLGTTLGTTSYARRQYGGGGKKLVLGGKPK